MVFDYDVRDDNNTISDQALASMTGAVSGVPFQPHVCTYIPARAMDKSHNNYCGVDSIDYQHIPARFWMSTSSLAEGPMIFGKLFVVYHILLINADYAPSAYANTGRVAQSDSDTVDNAHPLGTLGTAIVTACQSSNTKDPQQVLNGINQAVTTAASNYLTDFIKICDNKG